MRSEGIPLHCDTVIHYLTILLNVSNVKMEDRDSSLYSMVNAVHSLCEKNAKCNSKLRWLLSKLVSTEILYFSDVFMKHVTDYLTILEGVVCWGH